MRVAKAQLAAESGEDRIIESPHGVIVLDGASAFDPAACAAGEYVDVLGAELAQRLDVGTDLQFVLFQAITTTARRLQLEPNNAPSSTVAIARIGDSTLDILVLGDTAIVVGNTDGTHTVVVDDRLSALQLPESAHYRSRLREGSGYDDTHREILKALQRRQREQRNRLGGYWIAGADTSAANHAITVRFPLSSVTWVVCATDGAYDPLVELTVPWNQIAQRDSDDLHDLLAGLHTWEAESDPDGQQFPRAKRHDDKAAAVLRPEHSGAWNSTTKD